MDFWISKQHEHGGETDIQNYRCSCSWCSAYIVGQSANYKIVRMGKIFSSAFIPQYFWEFLLKIIVS